MLIAQLFHNQVNALIALQDQLCTPDDANRWCDSKREELVAVIRKFSFLAGGTFVSASNSKEAREIADTVDIHVRKAETLGRPNGRRYRFAMYGQDKPLSHAGNVADLVEHHLAGHINRIDEQGILHTLISATAITCGYTV